MASGDSDDSPSNAAMGVGGGGRWVWLYSPTWKWGGGVGRRWPGGIFIYKVLLESHCLEPVLDGGQMVRILFIL